MPAIFTPPGIDPHRKVNDGDHGSGQRPPTDKHTGGNGDGDEWSDRPAGRRGPRERLSQFRIGLGLALVVILMFFVGLITVFIVTKSNYRIDAQFQIVHDWRPIAMPRILWFNTAILLLSSATAELARRSMFRENDAMDEWIGLGRPISRRAGIWLSVTLLLGVLFLAGQTIAWQQLAAQRVLLDHLTSRKFFYIFTAVHAVHLALGLGALIVALIGLRRSRQFAARQIMVDTSAWYWHAMGVLWVLIFLVLEFGQ